MKLGAGEIVMIILLVLIIFGAGKLGGVGGAIGKSIKDLRNAVKGDDKPGRSKGKKHEESVG